MMVRKIRITEKKTDFTKITFAVLLIVLVGVSIFFLTKDNNEKPSYKGNVTDIVEQDGQIVSYRYNNFQFINIEGIWYTQIQRGSQPYTISFTYGPINLEDIDIEYKENLFPVLTTPRSKVYVSFDHDSTNSSYIATASINLVSNMKTVWGINVSRACMTNSSNCFGAPVVTCESNPDNAVIELVESDTTSILYEDNCLTIKARRDDFIKSAEKIILDWYGIV